MLAMILPLFCQKQWGQTNRNLIAAKMLKNAVTARNIHCEISLHSAQNVSAHQAPCKFAQPQCAPLSCIDFIIYSSQRRLLISLVKKLPTHRFKLSGNEEWARALRVPALACHAGSCMQAARINHKEFTAHGCRLDAGS
jgi:hypothetical protein